LALRLCDTLAPASPYAARRVTPSAASGRVADLPHSLLLSSLCPACLSRTPTGGVHLAAGVALARWCLPLLPRVVPARYSVALRHGVVFGSVVPVRGAHTRYSSRQSRWRCTSFVQACRTHVLVCPWSPRQDFDLVLTGLVVALTEDKVWIDRVREDTPRVTRKLCA